MPAARIALSFVAAAVLLYFSGEPAAAKPAAAAPDLAGAHGFDFEFGHWRVHHRAKRADGGWVEFEGLSFDRPIMGGSANVEDNEFHRPGGVITRGVAMRAYDAKTDQWAIWWVDSRDPLGTLDPPVKGRFEGGVGSFYSDAGGERDDADPDAAHLVTDPRPSRRAGSRPCPTDGGKTWDTNWIMSFQRK